ncbi:hypothetical protein WG926_13610 [Tistrella sp. BH-R2-4]|uniref:Uncharacterized protein n=1 Tax=Tistrella arctica TaxID=3133430 RepID=A0ABU9YL82_9PROT
MTGKSKTERAALDRLADALVEDILSAPDEDILAELRETEGDPERHAADMRARFEKSLIATNKKKLAAARAGVTASRRPVGTPALAIDISAARARLRAALATPGVAQRLTLAARKENEMSDTDVLSMLDDLRELGVLPEDGGNGGARCT